MPVRSEEARVESEIGRTVEVDVRNIMGPDMEGLTSHCETSSFPLT